jgi:MFS family permease
VLIPGLLLTAAGLLLFTRAPVAGDYVAHVLPVMVLLGFGAGLGGPALMTLAMTGVKPEEAGLASGLVNTTLQVGGAIGLAVLATLSTARTEALGSGAEALNGGYHLAYVIGAGLLLAAVAVATLVLERDPRPQRLPADACPEPAH